MYFLIVAHMKNGIDQGFRQSLSYPDQGVYFTSGLQDVKAIVGHSAEMVCKISNANYDGVWYKDGKKVSMSTWSVHVAVGQVMLHVS